MSVMYVTCTLTERSSSPLNQHTCSCL